MGWNKNREKQHEQFSGEIFMECEIFRMFNASFFMFLPLTYINPHSKYFVLETFLYGTTCKQFDFDHYDLCC